MSNLTNVAGANPEEKQDLELPVAEQENIVLENNDEASIQCECTNNDEEILSKTEEEPTVINAEEPADLKAEEELVVEPVEIQAPLEEEHKEDLPISLAESTESTLENHILELKEEPTVEPVEIQAPLEEEHKEDLPISLAESTGSTLENHILELKEEPTVEPVEIQIPLEKEHKEDLPISSAESTPERQILEEGHDVEGNENELENYNQHTREQLAHLMEELAKVKIEEVKQNIALLRIAFYSKTNELKKELFDKFLAEGGLKEDFQQTMDAYEERFKKSFSTYKEKRKQYIEEVERTKQENLVKKNQIIEELKKLIDSEETLKKTYDDFKALQERWKEIGTVPREEINNLWKNYHFFIEKFFDKVKINKELKMLDLKKNLEQKMILCEKVEELLFEESISIAFKKLHGYREQWREIGPVPNDKNEEIWERFNTAAEQVDLRRKEYYETMAEELQKNLLAKTALCEKAENILQNIPQTMKAWGDVTTELDELMKIWKTIGAVPKDSSEQIWNRFKSTLDSFYSSKKEYFDKIKDEQNDCYNKKLDLCVQSEEISKRTDWKQATAELLKLQQEWKNIGPVSRKVSDKIWTRFRGACDSFFSNKAAFFAEMKSSEADNLAKKEDLIKRLKEFQFSDDKNQNLDSIKEFQREWMEIGYVPIDQKERLQNEYRSTLNAIFDRLKISARETQRDNYKTYVENLVAKSTGFISREKADLQDKIQKLRSNLNLWENNLGFLAQSKQADILKKEFEKKMQSAKNEIALLEMKIKMLVESKENAGNTVAHTDKKEKPANEIIIEKPPVQENEVKQEEPDNA